VAGIDLSQESRQQLEELGPLALGLSA
jgi:hypothetical protein